jgi:hypothetical protein
MAAVTLLGAGTFNTTSGTHTVVATPAYGDLIVIFSANTGNTSAALPTDNNASSPGTYTEITACACVKATSVDQMRVFVRNNLIFNAASTTFSHAVGTSTGGGLSVFKVTGLARTGLSAAKQGAKQDNQAAAGTPTPVLGTAALTGNALIGAVFNATNPATMTPRTSWTERNDIGYATPTTGLETMSRDSGETATSIAWGGTSASAFCAAVLELNCSAEVPAELLMSPMLPPWRNAL